MKTETNTELLHDEATDYSTDKIKKNNKSFKTIIICVISLILVAAIVLAAISLTSDSFKAKHTTALEVDDTKVSVAEYNFYFMTYINTYINNNYSYLSSSGLDLSKPLSEQMIDDETSWYDYFQSMTNEYIRQIIVLSNLAEENDMGVTEEDKASADEYLSSMNELAEENDVSLKEYIKGNYGIGTDENVIRNVLLRFYTANRFSTEKSESIEITDEELENYYQQNSDTFDTADFRIMYFTPSYDDDASQSEIESVTAQSKANAEEMLSKITDEDSFVSLAKKYASDDVKENYSDSKYTLRTGITKSEMGDNVVSDWLFSSERHSGDKTMIEYNGTYYVMYIVSPAARADYNSVTLRSILVQPSTLGNTTPSEDEISQAKDRAESIVRIFESGEQSEEAFGELAKQYSEDTSTSATGGLYENIGLNQITDDIESWAFSEERNPGDIEIIQTGTSFHIVYFCGEGEPYWKIETEKAIQTEEIKNVITAATSEKEIEYNEKGLELVSKLLSDII